jgi:hypothetical protein
LSHRLTVVPTHDYQLLDKVKSANPAIKWAFENGQWVFGAASPRELLRKMLNYNLSGGVAEKITCPTLVLAGATPAPTILMPSPMRRAAIPPTCGATRSGLRLRRRTHG